MMIFTKVVLETWTRAISYDVFFGGRFYIAVPLKSAVVMPRYQCASKSELEVIPWLECICVTHNV
jgi:hypothetical protein